MLTDPREAPGVDVTLGADGFVAPDTPIDLTNCDREPIHIPGAIQPHGALLVLREPDLTIVQVSANTMDHLGIAPAELLGTSIAALVGDAQAAELTAPLTLGVSRSYHPVALTLRHARGTSAAAGVADDRVFDGVIHRTDGGVILELEPHSEPSAMSYYDFYAIVRETISHVEHAVGLVDLAQAIAEQMRAVTGLDRIWVYKFHEDWHGEIIAESKADGIETWLGMHYPASDIPSQARTLFLTHWLRMIVDMDFVPVPLIPRESPVTGGPLDMSGTVLRSVSPIHVQYLQNMGVRGSLVISLIKDGKLWGLISGHHYSGPKFVSYATRTVCEFLAQAFSTQLGMAERVEDREHELRVRAVQARLFEFVSRDDSLPRALAGHVPTMLDLTGATGGVVCVEGQITTIGVTPPRPWLAGLLEWLGRRGESTFVTGALSSHYPPAVAHHEIASGLIAVRMSSTRDDYVLWLRPENRQTVNWAGDPHKTATVGTDGVSRLSPRGSFELWEETVKGTATPWSASEISAASGLRGAIIDFFLRRADEISLLNTELERANAQLQENAVELEAQAEELFAQSELLAAQADELHANTTQLLSQRDAREMLLEREREARTEAERAWMEAERANKAKGDFLAMMSHELRTPLNAIGGYVDLLADGLRGPVNAAQQQDLRRVRRSADVLNGLLTSILEFARLDAGMVTVDLSDCRVGELFDDLEVLVAPQIRAKGLEFHHANCDATTSVRADRARLQQVVLNLLSNAIKFTPSGGRVSLTWDEDDAAGTLRIRVADTGRGIPGDALDRVFEPFVQIDRELTQQSQQGVGLGLAISRDLTRAMGGELTVASESGVGSTFTVTLPRA